MSDCFDDPKPAKRSDVGYGRPPIEKQFKRGQKPPPRKKRAERPLTASQTLTKILSEERRLKKGRQARWYPNAFLLIEVAFQLAEKGNASVSRALADYLMAGDPPETFSDQPRLINDPDGETGIRNYTVRRRL